MAALANAALLSCRSLVAAALLALPLAGAPLVLRLEQASSRSAPDFAPVYAGKTVEVKGLVSSLPISFPDYQQLPIQEGGYGLVLEGPSGSFDKLNPGDNIAAVGKISARAGLVILQPSEAPRVLLHGAAPAPEIVEREKLRSTRYLGRLVTTEGRVMDIGESSGGSYLVIGDSKNSYKLFVPYSRQSPSAAFPGINNGDLVRATGIASQYCPIPPYNRWFEMVMPSSAAVVRIAGGWMIDPLAVGAALALALLVGVGWWSRERRMRLQREMLTSVHELGEEIPGLSSTADILKRISAVMPRLFRISRVRLYVYSRGSKTLDEVSADPKGHPVSINVEVAGDRTETGAAACFQNRAQLVVPDAAKGPFSAAEESGGRTARSLLYVPMFVQGEVIGVIEIGRDKGSRNFTADEQTLAQHLANQTGLAIQLVGQRSVREQLFRTEKLAAVGRLISGVVNELQAPLATIGKMSKSLLADDAYLPAGRELRVIASEAAKASEIVTRMVSFAGGEQVEAKPVDINALLRSLIEFRDREWKARGIRVRDLTPDRPLIVMGSQGQLEQVFLNLLVHAEQTMTDLTEKIIVVRTSVLARRVLVEIGYRSSGEAQAEDPFSKWSENSSGALGLGVCRSIIAGHSGEVRLVHGQGAEAKFEVELPAVSAAEAPAARATDPGRARSRQRTAMLLEPDETAQRQLLTMLTSRGYRVVPMQTPEVAVDTAQRMRFDIVFCSIRLPGLNWVELSERFQPLVDAFVLVSEAYDPDLVISFERGRRFVVNKPFDAVQLDRVLAFAENPPSRRELIAG
jgi:C4-dicarboxylate-specific signal transduction histidine kinase/CheY-like chemotaxis protein